jgi:hypothetical protein
MGTDGDVDAYCTGGPAPADDGDDHDARFVFAFVGAQQDSIGGLCADGEREARLCRL